MSLEVQGIAISDPRTQTSDLKTQDSRLSSEFRMNLANRRVVVMGLGRFGGGVGVTRFLTGKGARVLVTDTAPADKLQRSVAQLSPTPGETFAGSIELRLGEHRLSDFTAADLIVVNPAVDQRANPYLAAAREKGVATTSEIRLLAAHLPNRRNVIGVTGSAGKSTTTAMIGHILGKRLAPTGLRVFIGGNLGGSLLPHADAIRPDDWVVLELSSFMLEDMAPDGWSPGIAVVTNIAPNHLDRHGSMEEYRRAKQYLLDFQDDKDVAVLGPGMREVFEPRTKLGTHMREAPAGPVLPLLVPGRHNATNAWLAVNACTELGLGTYECWEALGDFAGLPHRLQLVAEHNGVRYYNDSKATTPEAAMLALNAFEPGVAHIILGGSDKGSDFAALGRLARQRAAGVYTIGVMGEKIAAACEAGDGPAPIQRHGTLDDAMRAISSNLHSGHVVLLSPACASFDQYENYEQRGADFAQRVLQYTGE